MSLEAKTHTKPLQFFHISALWFSVNFWWAGVLGILLPKFVESLVGQEVKGTYLTLIAATGAALSSLIQLWIGPLSDRTTGRWGRRTPYVFWGVILTLPGIWLFFHAALDAKSFGLMMLAFCWIQIWLNVSNGPYQAYIADLVPTARQGTASAFMGMMLLLGQAAGLLAISLLKDNIHLVGYASIVLLALGALYTTAMVREPSRTASNLSPFRFAEILNLNLRRYPDFTWLMVSRFFINLAFYTALTFLLFYLQDALGSKKPEVDMVKLALVFSFTGVLGNWPAGRLSDRISKKRIVYFTCVLMSASAIAFVISHSLLWAFIIAAFFGISWGAFVAVDWAFACNLVPKEEEGRYMAIWHLAFTLPQVVAPWVGPFADWANHHWPEQPGIGWRIALSLMPIYLAIGAWCIRHVKEKVVSQQAA